MHTPSLPRSRRPRVARGFTLIEILVVIGMLAILSTVVLVAINPLRQFAQARNSQRQSNVAAILNAISERIADNGGSFVAPGGNDLACGTDLPDTATDLSDTASSALDIRSCIAPTYLTELPFDPSSGSNTCTDSTCTSGHYDLGYTIQKDSATSRITVCAPGAAENALPGSTPFCLSR
jgi:prepilin-type N-terminal cleavage/methylation domain-containing protein